MTFEQNPVLWLILVTLAITWTIFPFMVMYRLRKIHNHLDRSEQRDLAAAAEPAPAPEYQPEQPADDFQAAQSEQPAA